MHKTADNIWHGMTSLFVKWEEEPVDLSIPNFPVELICKIFSYLPHYEIGRTLPLVCLSWKELSEDNSLWEDRYFSTLPRYLHPLAKKVKIPCKEGLKSCLYSQTIAASIIEVSQNCLSLYSKDSLLEATLCEWEYSEGIYLKDKVLPIDDLNKLEYICELFFSVIGGESLCSLFPLVNGESTEAVEKVLRFDLKYWKAAQFQLEDSSVGFIFLKEPYASCIYFDQKKNLMVKFGALPPKCLVNRLTPAKFNFNLDLFNHFLESVQ